MRTTLLAAGVAALLLVVVAFNPLGAQNPAAPVLVAPNYSHGIAVVDITMILENYSRLKQANDAWKMRLDAQGKTFKDKESNLLKLVEEMKQHKAGTPKFRELEEKITQQKSDLEVEMRIEDKKFGEKKAYNYFMAYKEIANEVKAYSEQKGITLVIRVNNAPIDQNNPDAVRQDLMKMVQFSDPAINITGPVLESLNRKAAAASPPGQQAPVNTGARPTNPR